MLECKASALHRYPIAAVTILGLYLTIQGLASEQVKPDSDEMVANPPGYFMMGSDDDGDNEKPVHKVYGNGAPIGLIRTITRRVQSAIPKGRRMEDIECCVAVRGTIMPTPCVAPNAAGAALPSGAATLSVFAAFGTFVQISICVIRFD